MKQAVFTTGTTVLALLIVAFVVFGPYYTTKWSCENFDPNPASMWIMGVVIWFCGFATMAGLAGLVALVTLIRDRLVIGIYRRNKYKRDQRAADLYWTAYDYLDTRGLLFKADRR